MKTLTAITVMAALMLGGVAQAAFDMPLLYDTYVDEGAPGTSYGGLNVLRLQGQGQAIDLSGSFPVLVDYPVQRIFLQFNISAVPAGSVLTEAEFGIYINAVYEFDSPKLQMWVLNNDAWDESLTWTNSLALLGAQNKISLVQSAGSVDEYWKWTWSDMNQWDYTDALVNGKVSFLLTMDPEYQDIYNFAQFNSGENAAFQPYLRLAYIPEPATMGLLAMGIGGLVAFRKKN